MHMSGAQTRALADFADGAQIVILSAIFDPEVNPEKLWILREDGVQVTIDQSGEVRPWTEADAPKLEEAKPPRYELDGLPTCEACGVKPESSELMAGWFTDDKGFSLCPEHAGPTRAQMEA